MFDPEKKQLLAKGVVERIGMAGAMLTHVPFGREEVRLSGEILDHKVAIEYVLSILLSKNHGVCYLTLHKWQFLIRLFIRQCPITHICMACPMFFIKDMVFEDMVFMGHLICLSQEDYLKSQEILLKSKML
jgi:hypothetical protein